MAAPSVVQFRLELERWLPPTSSCDLAWTCTWRWDSGAALRAVGASRMCERVRRRYVQASVPKTIRASLWPAVAGRVVTTFLVEMPAPYSRVRAFEVYLLRENQATASMTTKLGRTTPERVVEGATSAEPA